MSFRDRTTMRPGEVTITPPEKPETPEQPTKFYVGGLDHEPTEEEALQMGLALFDAIASQQAREARGGK